MKNAIIAAVVAAIISATAGSAATLGLSRIDQVQNSRLTRLERHDVAQRARFVRLEQRLTGDEFVVSSPSGLVPQTQNLYQQLFGCLSKETPVIVRPDGTVAAPAAGETPTAYLVTLDPTRCFHRSG